MLDLFQVLSSPDVNLWTGVLWIIVMLLSDSRSDGTHSLPLVLHFSRSDEETNSKLRGSTFS